MKAIRIKTEHLTNPLGVDFQNPLITWCCEGGEKQTAYRIVAMTNGETVWDSGKVESSDMHVTYPLVLSSRQRVDFTITLWDEENREGEGSSAFFEMGLLDSIDFVGKWICGDYTPMLGKR